MPFLYFIGLFISLILLIYIIPSIPQHEMKSSRAMGLVLLLLGYNSQKYVDKSVSDIQEIYKIFQYIIIDHNYI